MAEEKQFSIRYGEDVDVSFMEKVFEVDMATYEQKYWGVAANQKIRFLHNERTFVFLMHGERLAGYINFLPTKPELWDSILCGDIIRDDDIVPDEFWDTYITEHDERDKEGLGNRLYIISAAIHEEYRGKEAAITLRNGFIKYLNTLNEDGFPITAIAATAVSPDGRKFLRNLNFYQYREIFGGDKDTYSQENSERVFLCDNEYLERLLDNKTYIKTHKDDIYLFLPYEDSVGNNLIDMHLIDGEDGEIGRDRDIQSIPDGSKAHEVDLKDLLGSLQDALLYEYNASKAEEISRYFLGTFQFLHTSDRYEGEEEITVSDELLPERYLEREIIGEERAYLALLAHKRLHLYVAMIIIPDCEYSSSQVEDQLSQRVIRLRQMEDENAVDAKGFYLYKGIDKLMASRYGLRPCGTGKTLLCMNKKPDTEQEMINILSSETFFSFHQNFFIRNEMLETRARLDRAVYDYYEAYMAERVLAVIHNNYDVLDDVERRREMATYIFIVELLMLQNSALSHLMNEVGIALEGQEDTLPYDKIDELYKNYVKIMRDWDIKHFKYYGTQLEAIEIRRAFENDAMQEEYQKQQDVLSRIVEMNVVRSEKEERERDGRMQSALTVLAVLALFSALMDSLGWLDLVKGSVERLGMLLFTVSLVFYLIIAIAGVFVLYVFVKNLKSKGEPALKIFKRRKD